MGEDKEKEQNKQKSGASSSQKVKNKIPLYREIDVNDPTTYYKRCCGMCGAGLAGNPCWKEDDDEIE
ncbi:MAG TPA: hypothetical protein GXX38_09700 [Clostridia bacterium]|jgi:hypothetical protein|nr:hypothetical protein [Clostridia bacterium]